MTGLGRFPTLRAAPPLPSLFAPKVCAAVIAVLRETRSNRYTLNTLSALLEGAGAAWCSAASGEALAFELGRALAQGRQALGLYSFMTPHLHEVGAEVRCVRALAPKAVLAAGGPHASADPEGTLALGFDHVFVGEGERTFPAFLAAGARGPSVVRDTAGSALDFGQTPAFGRERWGPVELTRGCRYDCSFCAVPAGTVRHRSPHSVWEAARQLLARGKSKIAFVTPDALSYGGSLDRLEGLLEGLVGAGLSPVLGTFPSEVRPDRVTPEAVALLGRYCANRTLVIGGQSGSDEVLSALRRGHTVADVERAAQVARGAGFTPHVDVIFGLPDEGAAEQAATVALAERLIRKWGARIHAHSFHPLPGTRYWSRDPSPLHEPTRAFLRRLCTSGVGDGWWEEQERWARQIVAWAASGVIRVPRVADV